MPDWVMARLPVASATTSNCASVPRAPSLCGLVRALRRSRFTPFQRPFSDAAGDDGDRASGFSCAHARLAANARPTAAMRIGARPIQDRCRGRAKVLLHLDVGLPDDAAEALALDLE